MTAPTPSQDGRVPIAEIPNLVLFVRKTKKSGSLALFDDHLDYRMTTKSQRINLTDITAMYWTAIKHTYQITLHMIKAQTVKIQGFKQEHAAILQEYCQTHDKSFEHKEIATDGVNWGDFIVSHSTLSFDVNGKTAFEVPLNSISQSVQQGKHEVSIEFHQEEQAQDGEQLVEMRIYVPPDMDDGADEEETAAARFNKEIIDRADIGDRAESIASFDQLLLLVPRGRYEIEMFPSFFKVHGKSFHYKILYKNVFQMFMMEKIDSANHIFVVGLNPPIRQGRTSYPYLIFQFNTPEEIQLSLNMDEKIIEEKYRDTLKPTMVGPTYDIISRVFKALTSKKVIVPGSFKSKHGGPYVRCSLKANDGHLFLLEKSFFFIKKPPTYIHHNQIAAIEFARVSGASSSSTKSFDMKIRTTEDSKSGEYIFSSINRDEYENLYDFCSKKNLKIENSEHPSIMAQGGRSHNQDFSGMDEDDPGIRAAKAEAREGELDSSEDEDYEAPESSEESATSSESDPMSEDEAGPKKTKPLKRKREDSDKKPKKPKEKSKEDKPKKKQTAAKKIGVKGAMSGFMFYSKAERKNVTEQHPEMGFGEIGAELGRRWKALTAEQKAPYEKMAKADRARFEEEVANAEATDDGKKKKDRKSPHKKIVMKTSKKDAFSFYYAEKQHELMSSNPNLSMAEIRDLLKKQWDDLDDDSKEPYMEQYRAEKKKLDDALEAEAEQAEKNVVKKEKGVAPVKKPSGDKEKKEKPKTTTSKPQGTLNAFLKPEPDHEMTPADAPSVKKRGDIHGRINIHGIQQQQ